MTSPKADKTFSWRQWARQLKHQTLALFIACRDPQTPKLIKLLALFLVAYAVNPLDLIPDFIPVVGLLDDLLLLPLGIWLVMQFIPDEVWQRSLDEARLKPALPDFGWMTALIVITWILLTVVFGLWLLQILNLS
jgi:uncharacterized membrane protein YkvA (DUF1232 family)